MHIAHSQWWSEYLVMHMHSAINDLSCYIAIIYKTWCESLNTPSSLICSLPTDGISNSMDMSLSELWETVKDRAARRAAGHGVKDIRTWPSNWTTPHYQLLVACPREIFTASWRSSFQSTSFWQRPMSPCLSDSTSVSTSLCQFRFCGFSKDASLNGGLLKLIEPTPHRMQTSSEPRTPQVVLTCVFSDLKALSVLGRRSWGPECLLQPVCRTRLKRVLATARCYVLIWLQAAFLRPRGQTRECL